MLLVGYLIVLQKISNLIGYTRLYENSTKSVEFIRTSHRTIDKFILSAMSVVRRART
jgi:hypothetical protein